LLHAADERQIDASSERLPPGYWLFWARGFALFGGVFAAIGGQGIPVALQPLESGS